MVPCVQPTCVGAAPAAASVRNPTESSLSAAEPALCQRTSKYWTSSRFQTAVLKPAKAVVYGVRAVSGRTSRVDAAV